MSKVTQLISDVNGAGTKAFGNQHYILNWADRKGLQSKTESRHQVIGKDGRLNTPI